jgi:ethanolamine ammonia-lyase small subunit
MMNERELVTPDPWRRLREATPARIALGRSGGSLPTSEWLAFRAAHAAARDAVHIVFEANGLAAEIRSLGVETIVVDSAAASRDAYLRRPDLGRALSAASREQMAATANPVAAAYLAIIVSDGLSALAAHRQAVPLLAVLLPRLAADGWRLAPIIVARFGRVALEDQVGQLLGAEVALMLIGERPGLGSPDSLGAYLVFDPKPNNTDAQRNCVSNIRPEGLDPETAAETVYFLLTEARRRRISGVGLKNQRTLTSPRE